MFYVQYSWVTLYIISLASSALPISVPELFAGIILGKLESSVVKLELSSSASHLLQCGATQRKELMKKHMNERRRRERRNYRKEAQSHFDFVNTKLNREKFR